MLLLHETHEVKGRDEEAFDRAYRDGWMPRLASDPGARLLYYLRQAHGTGPSYRVITITALRDAAAWESLARRVDSGDLAAWVREVDGLRHEVHAKFLRPLPWSPLQHVDLASVPTAPAEHELTLFMEDTVWPFAGKLDEYIERSGSHYAEEMKRATTVGPRLLTVDAAFRTAFGSHRRREIVLWQKVVRPEGLLRLLTHEVPPEYMKPGTWMHDALDIRDQWQSRMLRTVSWSPWY
jgi:hypothetical protein